MSSRTIPGRRSVTPTMHRPIERFARSCGGCARRIRRGFDGANNNKTAHGAVDGPAAPAEFERSGSDVVLLECCGDHSPFFKSTAVNFCRSRETLQRRISYWFMTLLISRGELQRLPCARHTNQQLRADRSAGIRMKRSVRARTRAVHGQEHGWSVAVHGSRRQHPP